MQHVPIPFHPFPTTTSPAGLFRPVSPAARKLGVRSNGDARWTVLLRRSCTALLPRLSAAARSPVARRRHRHRRTAAVRQADARVQARQVRAQLLPARILAELVPRHLVQPNLGAHHGVGRQPERAGLRPGLLAALHIQRRQHGPPRRPCQVPAGTLVHRRRLQQLHCRRPARHGQPRPGRRGKHLRRALAELDHFGDTWLPSGKLSRNKRTGEVTRLFAWKGYHDPAPGVFSLEVDPDGTSQYLLNWNGSMEYWTSGNWTGHGFSTVPEMTATNAYAINKYSFRYVDKVDESYFFYDVKDEAVVTRFLMWVPSAGAWILFWAQPNAQSDVYALCGPFAACVANELPSCRCLRGFRERRPQAWLQGDHAEGCVRDTALQPCATREAKNGDGFYAMPHVTLPTDARGVAAAASARDCEVACLGDCSYKGSCWLWHGGLMNLQTTSSTGTGSGSGTILIRLAASEFTSPGRTKTLIIALAAVAAAVAAVTVIILVSAFVVRRRRAKAQRRVVEGSLMSFTYRDMQSVTNNFSDKLGGGSFGSVFKGSLPDATATLVAVKKLEGVRQGEKQFRAEVSTIGTIQLMGHDFSRVLTTVRGTVGYLAPEWIAGQAITTKADVYSYGMMLLEIVSGRRNLRRRQDGMLDFFPLLAARMLTEGQLDGLLDCGGAVDSAEVERACKVACWCIQDDESARPTMTTVVHVLEGLVEVNVPPVPRSLTLFSELPSD